MNTTDKIMALADALSDADFELARINSYGGDTTKAVSAAKAAQDKLRAAIEALVRDAEELAFLKNDLLSWVDRAVEKGNANSDIQEASERYDQWLKTRHAAMQEKQS